MNKLCFSKIFRITHSESLLKCTYMLVCFHEANVRINKCVQNIHPFGSRHRPLRPLLLSSSSWAPPLPEHTRDVNFGHSDKNEHILLRPPRVAWRVRDTVACVKTCVRMHGKFGYVGSIVCSNPEHGTASRTVL